MKPYNETQQRIADFIKGHPLAGGLGSITSACTIAAINIVLSRQLTDKRPACVCPVIYSWVIPIQDAIPDAIRNNGWSKLVPFIAGSYNPEKEFARGQILLEWLEKDVLPQIQLIADLGNFGSEWKKMLTEKTLEACYAADKAATNFTAAKAAYWYTKAITNTDIGVVCASRVSSCALAAARIPNTNFWQNCHVTETLERLLFV